MTEKSLLTVNFIVHGDYAHIMPALRSLYETTRTPMSVYVVINTGSDPRIDDIRTAFPEVNIIINPEPLGFAANHNQVMARTDTPYIALLNDDITLHDGALDTLVDYLKAHPEAGLVAPFLLNPDGSPQVMVYSDPSLFRMIYKISGLALLTREGSVFRDFARSSGIGKLMGVQSLDLSAETRAVDTVKGVAMVLRREIYDEVGPMDEATIVYGEEVDWHWRIRQGGWKVVLVQEARVTHYYGSGQEFMNVHGWKLREDRKGILNFYIKHRPRWQEIIIRAAITLTHGLRALLWLPISRKRASEHAEIARMGATWRRQATS
jgi:hypothetical protein